MSYSPLSVLRCFRTRRSSKQTKPMNNASSLSSDARDKQILDGTEEDRISQLPDESLSSDARDKQILDGTEEDRISQLPDESLSSDARDKQILDGTKEDRISELPDELLVMILKDVATEDAVKTSVLSQRWKNVWKDVPNLVFDMGKATVTNMEHPVLRSARVAKKIAQVISNHNGRLEGCIIKHDFYQCHNDVLETWIRLLTLQKHTKALSLSNLRARPRGLNLLQLSPNTFSHPMLEALFLCHYELKTAHAFNRCHNLIILKLDQISAKFDVLNTVIASCPSLKVLVLHVKLSYSRDFLKIRNKNLRLLHLACSNVFRFEVFAPLLEIFSFDYDFDGNCNFVIHAPRLWFIPNYGSLNIGRRESMMYNISCKAEEIDNLGDKFLVSRDANFVQNVKYLTVAVDVMNWEQVEMLRSVLVARNELTGWLCIIFKNVAKEEGESSNGGTQVTKWEEKVFPSADFSVETVYMVNFNGSRKQFALASRFITQGTVKNKMMFETSSVPEEMKPETEAAVAKLMKLPKGNEELEIGYY
ncbi:hypothetical protein CARUB_v10021465mg [Capsella rubella]|uniref:F-box domain-containing protein n=1 Tax=Capsella rubella TaxID=81985 RepID=R0I7D6_9BRAS|nr:putative F-box protein At1g67390 [Capsella rubella]EOA33970.1 hypothetical protein CARUB_v10021465mg [Capsella rubella]